MDNPDEDGAYVRPDVLGGPTEYTPGDINDINDCWVHIVSKAIKNGLKGILDSGGISVTIGTMCSGTDAPIFALKSIEEALLALGYDGGVSYQHKFSVEIEAFKQAFILRNNRPDGPVYRDVLEVADPKSQMAYVAPRHRLVQ
jgi:hypothetical protein